MKKEININKFDARLSRAYSTTENKQQQYDDWAQSYESDLVNDLGYVAHKDASELFARIVPDKAVRILDVACGTGLVGDYLKGLGYLDIAGVDFSQEMLNISEQRNVYSHLWQQDFTQPAELEHLYDALICVGLFAFSVPKISDLHHVVNCVKPGAHCIITINGAAWKQLDLKPAVYAEAELHGFNINDIIHAEYIRKEGIDSQILVITR